VFWPNNAHQPGVAPKQRQQQTQQEQELQELQQQHTNSIDHLHSPTPTSHVLKVVVKFRIHGSSSDSNERKPNTGSFRARSIPPHTASSASCMGMAAPYHHEHEDTQGTSGSEKVEHRNVGG
jgi:hypothetical protein